MSSNISEASIKRAITDYLEIGQAQGRWVYLRLNSGDFIEVRGDTRRRIKGCMAGTSDLLVIKQSECEYGCPTVIFIELKSAKGRQSPEQRAFQKLVEMQRASYNIVHSFEELENILMGI